MERRAFLALIATAPIAALAPLPKLLRLAFHPDAFKMAMEPARKRYWQQACDCRPAGVQFGDFVIGPGIRHEPRKPPHCTRCGTDWRAEYV